jgi:hypothetical protein
VARRTDFKAVTQSDLDQVAAELNDRPAVEVVKEEPEADVGLRGDFLDARPVAAAFGD